MIHIAEVIPGILADLGQRLGVIQPEELVSLEEIGRRAVLYERAKRAHDAEPANDTLAINRSTANKMLHDALKSYLKREGT